MTSSSQQPRPDVPTVLGGLGGIALLSLGSIWPWFDSDSGPVGTLPWPVLLWATMVVATAALVAAMTGLRRSVAWIAFGVAVALAAVAAVTAEPSWMCWDGVDGDGNMIGGCSQDQWTYAPVLFGAGLVLVALAILRALLIRREGGTPLRPTHN